MKRLLDIIIVLMLLPVASPICLIIAALIKIDSGGPVFFIQERLGQDKSFFRLVKFRSMFFRAADEVDQIDEPILKDESDSRITRVGRMLRASSLDELPQLINVLKGDMSLVGPRPLLPEQLNYIPPLFLDRFCVRPGLTGLAQVEGRRCLGWLNQLSMDHKYVESRSVSGDIKILLRTFKVVAKREGVYAGDVMNWRDYRALLNGRAPRDLDIKKYGAKK